MSQDPVGSGGCEKLAFLSVEREIEPGRSYVEGRYASYRSVLICAPSIWPELPSMVPYSSSPSESDKISWNVALWGRDEGRGTLRRALSLRDPWLPR